ncbi:uncharacterized protein MYCFIDRAFT_107748, partial [Pseudocercospora fijiensis CIRAD86]
PRRSTEEPDLKQLNAALAALVDIFPDVQPEVFREMLLSVSEDSRLQIVTEHLLQKKAKWVQGRYRTPQSSQERTKVKKRRSSAAVSREHGLLEDEDLFRGENYKKAVKQVFHQEFRNLRHSTIKGVLAEQNFSYTLARPILQQLASKSWRLSFTNFWPRKAAYTAAEGHPFIIWQPDAQGGQGDPAVRQTGSGELDRELYDLFVAPIVLRQRQDRERADYLTASELNEAAAEEAEALFDCECCFSSVSFEKIATCDEDCHALCLDCIRRTVNEALYGQGWSRTAHLGKATVRCFSPMSQDCHGVIPPDLVRRAVTQGADNEDAWHDYQARITSETLLESGLPLQRCPFCSYAESNEIPQLCLKHPKALWSHINSNFYDKLSPAIQILFMALVMMLAIPIPIFTIPLLLLVGLGWLVIHIIPEAAATFDRSISRVHKRRRGIRFRCQNSSCMKVSCSRCLAAWRDPHSCFESEKTSLRTAIEASATAAVKRTCPRCYLSFVKSSGCNKLVCNCGYTMCYICRSEITSKEGYAHFCQHFRPNGGRCAECERCDLYGDEDEEAAIRRAAEEAEQMWREKEGG